MKRKRFRFLSTRGWCALGMMAMFVFTGALMDAGAPWLAWLISMASALAFFVAVYKSPTIRLEMHRETSVLTLRLRKEYPIHMLRALGDRVVFAVADWNLSPGCQWLTFHTAPLSWFENPKDVQRYTGVNGVVMSIAPVNIDTVSIRLFRARGGLRMVTAQTQDHDPA